MNTFGYLILFLIASLACFRLALLVSSDSGPYRAMSKLRSWLRREAKHNTPLRKSAIQEGVSCIRCSSIWFAFLITIYLVCVNLVTLKVSPLYALALSASAILMNRVK